MLQVHKPYVLGEDGDHKFVWLGLDESEHEKGILTNQYLIMDKGESALIDPGGYFVFERVFNNVQSMVDPEKITKIMYSHQDPDVIGSLNLLLDMFPNAKFYVSYLWERFIPHLGVSVNDRIVDIPDEGMDIKVGESILRAVPAHFMHSPGNFHYYDPRLKIYFSGDMGAAIYPKGTWYLIVDDFETHRNFMEPFHRRYIASRKAIDLWKKTIENLEIDVVAPQHGSVFIGDNAKKFLEWLWSLDKVGLDLM
ncbi:MBL fold metallo-hydrolase [Sulfuracidifex metallicus]|uniref:MBL fold metallo-hydrolase n=1 Tax=Sulfuracidifex metallicus TaxID=47303 RepID=UPI0006D0CD31|nr:MBL fold metallo-hydrolase [Sulfuracidifex metallicus]